MMDPLAAFPFCIVGMDDIGMDEVLAHTPECHRRLGHLRASPQEAPRQDRPALQQGNGLGRAIPLVADPRTFRQGGARKKSSVYPVL